MTVKELYDELGKLVDEYGDLEVLVSYDTDFASTPIRKVPPEIRLKPMREYSKVIFKGY